LYYNNRYKVGIVIDVNTFSNGALTYTLTKDSSSSTNGKLANETTETIDQSSTQYIEMAILHAEQTMINTFII